MNKREEEDKAFLERLTAHVTEVILKWFNDPKGKMDWPK